MRPEQPWNIFVSRMNVRPEEQSCDLRLLVRSGKLDEATRRLFQRRDLFAETRALFPRAANAEVNDAFTASRLRKAFLFSTVLEDDIARALARIAAGDPRLQPDRLRRECIGRTEPFSPAEAWKFLKPHRRAGSPMLHVEDGMSDPAVFCASPDTPLMALRQRSIEVASLLGWSAPKTAWWLLTGKPPDLRPILVYSEKPLYARAHGRRIVISALPHVDPASVRDTFAIARRGVLNRDRGPISVKRRAMSEFVDHHRGKQGKLPSWPVLHASWQAIVPVEWLYKTWRHMERDFKHENGPQAAVATERPRPRNRRNTADE